MGEFFVRVYHFLQPRKILFYGLMIGLTILFGLLATRLSFQEDITSFFPDTGKDSARNALIFKNLKIKDRIIVMISRQDTTDQNPDILIEYADQFKTALAAKTDSTLVKSVLDVFDEEKITETIEFIYRYLPVYLEESDYTRLDSLLTDEGIDQQMQKNYHNLISPMGMAIREVVLRDPFGMGGKALSGLNIFNQFSNYTFYDQHIFAENMHTLLMFIEPAINSSASNGNEQLVDAIEDSFAEIGQASSGDARLWYYGGAGMAVYNARQIKQDTLLTLTIAMIIILVFILLVFRKVKALLLIVAPVLFGTLFALALIYLVKGQISAIAIGGGAAIMGIALSHSIHILSHSYHAKDVAQVIRELTYPLTVGSFTTIGAFLGLLFTSSPLLRDFGLFSALLLIGTTLFSLIFLPHFLFFPKDGFNNSFIRKIEVITSYAYDRNKYLIGSLFAVLILTLFYFNDVRFNYDMMKLNYMPDHIQEAEQKLTRISGNELNGILLISAAHNTDSALVSYKNVYEKLKTVSESGKINSIISAADFFLPTSEQQKRIDNWNRYWTTEKKQRTIERVERGAVKHGFNSGSFTSFDQLLMRNYVPLDFNSASGDVAPVFADWINRDDSMTMFLSQVRLDNEDKDAVYRLFEQDPSVSIVDRSYFIGKMAQSVNTDFYTVLWISSVLIFIALMISYGRIELACLAFIPMTLSWVIILGLMAIFGIEFNIVNIILSTFIFGIGDDFSIFIMDGLLSEYRNGKKILAVHKTAIFFSVVTIVVGMGVLVFAQHPAIRSLAFISLLGILAVVLIAYVVQPILFRAFVTSQTRKGGYPYTFAGVLNTIYCFTFFVLGCLLLNLCILCLKALPIKTEKRQRYFMVMVNRMVRLFLKGMITVRIHYRNIRKKEFETPAIIIANHESFIDLLIMLSLSPKMIMVTNSWVWNSPVFGRIVRFAGFIHAEEGHEEMLRKVASKKEAGYSVLVFPEGTRTEDAEMKRFHKGAFHLAGMLAMDILPVVLYGNGLISSKKQPFYIKKGEIAVEMFSRIKSGDPSFGVTTREQVRQYRTFFREEHEKLALIYNRSGRGYYYDALIKNYTYKGPVLEWYMRIKVLMESQYRFFDRLVPRDASIVDIGCGYGPLSLMLALMDNKRTVLGIDYDEEKIDVARNCFSAAKNTTFICSDALTYSYPAADVFILNDMLHYMDYPSQEILIAKCAASLNREGMIIIRDGDSEKDKEHELTKWTEKWSTEIVGFNKTSGKLHFLSSAQIYHLADKLKMDVEQIANDRFTSNTLYLLTKKDQEHA